MCHTEFLKRRFNIATYHKSVMMIHFLIFDFKLPMLRIALFITFQSYLHQNNS